MAAIRSTLTEVLTDEAFARMLPLGLRWAEGVDDVIRARGVPWHVARLGARAEYHFMPTPPRNGSEQWAARGRRARAVPPPLGHEPRRAHDAVPQHGADVARDTRRPTSTATPRCSTRPWRPCSDDRRAGMSGERGPLVAAPASGSPPPPRPWYRRPPILLAIALDVLVAVGTAVAVALAHRRS